MTSRFWGARQSGLLIPGSTPFPGYKLALDFQNGRYWQNGLRLPALSSVNGYSYTRTGTVGYADGKNGYASFAANSPPVIPGVGYKAHGGTTNRLLQSQDMTTTWANTGSTNSAPAASVTKNAGVAPDGTTTASRFTCSNIGAAVDCLLEQNATNFTFPAFITGSVWIKSTTALNQNLGLAVQWNTADSHLITVTPQWQRFSMVSDTNAHNNHATEDFSFGVFGDPFWGVVSTSRSIDVYVWQAQLLQDNYPDGGPAIVTTTGQVSVGASTLSFSVPNGTYSAVYTFDDGSTQTIATTIAAGTFTIPNYPTLNRPTLAMVTLK